MSLVLGKVAMVELLVPPLLSLSRPEDLVDLGGVCELVGLVKLVLILSVSHSECIS